MIELPTSKVSKEQILGLSQIFLFEHPRTIPSSKSVGFSGSTGSARIKDMPTRLSFTSTWSTSVAFQRFHAVEICGSISGASQLRLTWIDSAVHQSSAEKHGASNFFQLAHDLGRKVRGYSKNRRPKPQLPLANSPSFTSPYPLSSTQQDAVRLPTATAGPFETTQPCWAKQQDIRGACNGCSTLSEG